MRDVETRDLGVPAQQGTGGVGQGIGGFRRRPRVGGAGVTPGLPPVGPWEAGPHRVFRGRARLGGLPCWLWSQASARGLRTGRGAAMGPPGPGRRAVRAPSYSQVGWVGPGLKALLGTEVRVGSLGVPGSLSRGWAGGCGDPDRWVDLVGLTGFPLRVEPGQGLWPRGEERSCFPIPTSRSHSGVPRPVFWGKRTERLSFTSTSGAWPFRPREEVRVRTGYPACSPESAVGPVAAIGFVYAFTSLPDPPSPPWMTRGSLPASGLDAGVEGLREEA